MALIPDDPKQRNAFFVIAGWVLAAVAFYMYVYSPRQVTLEENQARLTTLTNQNRSAGLVAIGGVDQLRDQLAVLERHVMRLEELIPAQDEVSSLVRTITEEGSRLNVEVARILPEPPEPQGYYTRRVFELRAIGEYHAIGRFVTAIASLPRIITPVGMELVPFSDPQGVYDHLEAPLDASFRIETYQLPEGGTPPPVMGGGPEGGQ